MAKKSRKELLKTPDDFLTFTEKASRWVIKNQRRLTIGMVAVLVVVGVVFALVSYNKSHQRSGAVAYGKAFFNYQEALANPSPAAWAQLVASLNTVSSEYASTYSGKLASLNMAAVLINLGDYAKAEEVLRNLLDEPGLAAEISALAWGTLGQCLEVAGKSDEATQAYAKAAHASGPASADIWKTAQARLLQGTNQQLSQDLYKQVAANSGSQFLRLNAIRTLISEGQDISQIN